MRDDPMVDGNVDNDVIEEADDNAMIDVLVSAGVDYKDANDYLYAVKGKLADVTFMEMYGAGSIMAEAARSRRSLNVRGLDAMDLRTCKPSGECWDFTQASDRRLARKMVKEKAPR